MSGEEGGGRREEEEVGADVKGEGWSSYNGSSVYQHCGCSKRQGSNYTSSEK